MARVLERDQKLSELDDRAGESVTLYWWRGSHLPACLPAYMPDLKGLGILDSLYSLLCTSQNINTN